MAWRDRYIEPLTGRELSILEEMEIFAKKNRGAFPSILELSKLLNLAAGTVKSDLDSLEEKGAIRTEKISRTGREQKIICGSRFLGRSEGIFRKEAEKFEGIKQIRVALIPHISKVKNKEKIISKENITEYVAIPEEFIREENMFAFTLTNKFYEKVPNITEGALLVVDTKAKYLSQDFVAKIRKDEGYVSIEVARYSMVQEREENGEYIYLGKIVGSYCKITY